MHETCLSWPRMSAAAIHLTVPGTLRYRDLAVRAVAEAARLVSGSGRRDPDDVLDRDVRDPFDTAIVSAFAEIFNNVAIHAYRDRGDDTIEVVLWVGPTELVIELQDRGAPFDLRGVAPMPTVLDDHTLPEGGMGIHIARTMLDDVTYVPGPPNRWRLRKRLAADRAAARARRS